MDSTPIMSAPALVGEAITRYLIRHQLPSGTLHDEWDNAPTPDGNCANALFALALIRLFRLTGEDRIMECLLKVLGYLVRLPDARTGHREFIQYAFLKALAELPGEAKLSPEIHDLLKRRLKRLIVPKFDSGRYTVHGNNWVTLKALDCILLGQVGGLPKTLHRGKELIRRYTLNWQDSDGLFADFPRDPLRRSLHRLTPLTYHGATCFFLLEAFPFIKDPLLYRALIRGIDVLSFWVDDDGKFAPYGRGNYSLFGVASAAAVFLRAGRELGEVGRTISPERASEWNSAGLRVIKHLERLQLPDGSVLLNPGSGGRNKGSWDFYMHHTVYNAFAAALLLDPRIPRTELIRTESSSAGKMTKTFFFQQAGLLLSEFESGRVVLSLQGQRSLPEFELDPRSSGMNPFSLRSKGHDLIPPPPVPPSVGGNPIGPGFVPCLRVGNREYHPYTWNRVRVWKVDDHILVVQGHAAFDTGNPWRRFQTSLNRWLRRPAFRKMHLEEIARMLNSGPFLYGVARSTGPALPRLKRTIVILKNPFTLLFQDRIENKTNAAVSWHPIVLRLFPGWRRRESEIVWGSAGGGGRVRFQGAEPEWCREYRASTALGTCSMLFCTPAEIKPGEARYAAYAISPLGEPVIRLECIRDRLVIEGESRDAGKKRSFRFPVPA